jgi:tetratricopeptide (TPR) repeat protein
MLFRSALPLLFLATTAAHGAAPTPAEIAKAIGELGSSSFKTRQKASLFLWGAGVPAEPALRRALKSEDREVARRAREILDKFKYGIYPSTPKKIVDLVARYRSGSAETKHEVIGELAKLGTGGQAVLVKLAAAEDDVHLRRELFYRLSGDVVPSLLAAGRFDEVEELLELALKGGDQQAFRNYAAYLSLRGRLAAKIPFWTKKAKKLTGYQAAEVLLYMERAKGDAAKTLWAARKTGKKPLLASVLIEQGRWKDLAADPEVPTESADPLEMMAYMAAYNRLAGNSKQLEKIIASLKSAPTPDPFSVRKKGIALLLNDRPADGIEFLKKAGDIPVVFELLAAQHRFKEAFDLARDFKGGPDWEDYVGLGLAKARAHLLTGDPDQAVKGLKKLSALAAERAAKAKDCSPDLKLVEGEMQIRLDDLAFAHAAQVALQAEKENQMTTLLGHLFTDRGEEAAAWWDYYRKKRPTEKPADTLKKLRTLLTSKLPAKDFAGLAEDFEKVAGTLKREEEKAQWLEALGEGCVAYHRDDRARKYFEKADSATALARLGDLLAEKNQWRPAAEFYGKAWEKDRSKPGPLFLRGRALERGGAKEEGRKLMELAHLIPLANDHTRFKFAQSLARKGHLDAATREWQLLARTARYHYAELSNTLRFLGMEAYAKGKFDFAADCHERTILVCLGNIYFVRSSAYLTVPSGIHFMRARGWMAKGKIKEALQEMDLCLAALPGDIDSTIQLVPDLDKRGFKKEADGLFKRVLGHYAKVCKAYPKSAQLDNSAAWLAVCCRRRLDDALAYAKKAVELAPKTAAYLDTLAEVYYQRGDKATALRHMKKCLELDPQSDYYRKQIKRFQKEGPPSETPR